MTTQPRPQIPVADMLIPADQRLAMQVLHAQRQQDVSDMLEDMAPDLLHINASAAETAALIVLRLRALAPGLYTHG